MGAHIAHRPRPEIPPAPPGERMIGRVIGAPGRRPEPDIPVDGARAGRELGRGLDPLRPDRPVRPDVDLGHRADGPVPDPLVEEPGAFLGVPLVAHLGDDVHLLRGLGQHPGFLDRVGQRLLAVDVLAALHRRHGDDGVGMVGRGHGDRVQVLLFVQHLAEVAVLGGLIILGLLLGRVLRVLQQPGHHLVVDVAEGDDVLGADALDVAGAAAPGADAADVDGVAGRLVAPPEDVPGDDHQPGRGQGRTLHEFTPGYGFRDFSSCLLFADLDKLRIMTVSRPLIQVRVLRKPHAAFRQI